MKLTPMDIHHKEFRHSLRGYDEKEVDNFLDDVADEFERLFKENIDLSERLEGAKEQVRSYQEMERTLHNTLVSAQRSAEDIVSKAGEEAATLLRDAEVKAKEIIHDALTQKQKVAGELVRIKQAEEQFRAEFSAALERHLKSVKEVTLPDDVNVLVGATDAGIVSEVEVAAESARAALEQASEEAASAAVPLADQQVAAPAEPPVEPPAPRASRQDARPSGRAADLGATQAMPAVEVPESGFVTSVTLGEVDGPALPDDIELEAPREFAMPGFDSLGEREDDIDIEEID